MPVYLVHGFRWPRIGFTGIRVHAIVSNLEDCSVEYIQNEASKMSLLQSFRDQYPHLMLHLEDNRTGRTLDFIEPYDPHDELSDSAVSQAYAFVADRVLTIAAGASTLNTTLNVDSAKSTHGRPPATASTVSSGTKRSSTNAPATSLFPVHNPSALSLNVDEAMSNGPAVTPQAWEALAELRDKIAEGEKIGWWVVYNGDPERTFSDAEDEAEDSQSDHGQDSDEEGALKTPTQRDSSAGHGILGRPLPTLFPPEMRHLVASEDPEPATAHAQIPSEKEVEGHTLPDTTSTPGLSKTEAVSVARPKSSKSNFTSNFSFPLRRKSSKVNMPLPKEDHVPEPPVLKDINKKEGRRYRFFGGKNDK